MKKTKKATSILEAMIVLLIIITGILGLYNIFDSSQKMSNSTKNRIEAIEIAKEGIESLKNIRDTNWLKFAGDKNQCFNTFNYDSKCVGDDGTNPAKYIENNISYIIYKGIDSKWYLEEITKNPNSDEFKEKDYRDNFRVYKKNGYYTQTGSYDKETIFTREIEIKNKTNTGFTVHSIVQWADSSKSGSYRIDLENRLTNWKK